MTRSSAAALARRLWGLAAVLVAWELLSLAIGSRVFPSPRATVEALRILASRELLVHASASMGRLGAALALQLFVGLGLGIWLGASRRADDVLGSSVYLLYPTPKIAFLPLFLVLFGLGELSKILFVATVLVFQTIVAARDGAREIAPGLFLTARSLGLGRRATCRHVLLPALGPRIVTSLRLGTGIGMAVLFFAETYATRYGLGYLVMNSFAMADYPAMFASILTLSLIGLLIFSVIDLVERRLCAWTKAGIA